MSNDENPYRAPAHLQKDESRSRWGLRALACSYFVFPFGVAMAIRFWAFNFAGTAFVSTEIDPDHRLKIIDIYSKVLMTSIVILFHFAGIFVMSMRMKSSIFMWIACAIYGILSIPSFFVVLYFVSRRIGW